MLRIRVRFEYHVFTRCENFRKCKKIGKNTQLCVCTDIYIPIPVLLALLNLTEVGRLGKSSTMAVSCQRHTRPTIYPSIYCIFTRFGSFRKCRRDTWSFQDLGNAICAIYSDVHSGFPRVCIAWQCSAHDIPCSRYVYPLLPLPSLNNHFLVLSYNLFRAGEITSSTPFFLLEKTARWRMGNEAKRFY